MNLRLLSPVLLVLFLLIQVPAGLYAGKPLQEKWSRLGERTAPHTIDHSEITFDAVEKTANALRVKVKKGALNLHRCVVYYKNGQTSEVTILNSIPQGGDSKIIELPHSDMLITRIVLTYDTKNRATQQAIVELWFRN